MGIPIDIWKKIEEFVRFWCKEKLDELPKFSNDEC